MAPRDQLPGHVKAYIVQRLARFDTPSQVVRGVKDEFDLVVTRQRVHFYDPTTRLGAALNSDLKVLFQTTRQAFLTDPPTVAIANKNYRLAVWQRALDLAESRGQLPEIRAALEGGAKESGDVFTNKRLLEHTGKGGGPVQSVVMTGDEFEAIARKVADEV